MTGVRCPRVTSFYLCYASAVTHLRLTTAFCLLTFPIALTGCPDDPPSDGDDGLTGAGDSGTTGGTETSGTTAMGTMTSLGGVTAGGTGKGSATGTTTGGAADETGEATDETAGTTDETGGTTEAAEESGSSGDEAPQAEDSSGGEDVPEICLAFTEFAVGCGEGEDEARTYCLEMIEYATLNPNPDCLPTYEVFLRCVIEFECAAVDYESVCVEEENAVAIVCYGYDDYGYGE